MNVIYPSEKRKLVIGEIINIDSPFLLVYPYYSSDHLTNFPFKIISCRNVERFKEDSSHYECVIIDPELLYPKSPLFREKYKILYDFLKKTKFRNVSVVSASLPRRVLLSFLREIGSKDRSICIFPEFSFGVKSIFCEDKVKELERLDLGIKNLIICKNKSHGLFLYELLKDRFGKRVFVLRSDDFDHRRKITIDFIANGGVLIVPRRYRWFFRKVEFDKVIFLNLPKSIEEFLYFSSVFSVKEYVFLVSSSDEYKVSKKFSRDGLFLSKYIEFLNFLGSKGNKIEYLEGYLCSKRIRGECRRVESDGDERVLCNFFSNRYFEFERGVDVIIGVGEWYMFFEYGAMRGKSRDYVKEIVNNLVSRGILGYRYFYSDGRITKKVY